MTVSHGTGLEQELATLKATVGRIGDLVAEQLGHALVAIEHRSTSVARDLVVQDRLSNDLARIVEEQALRITADGRAGEFELRHVMLAIHLASNIRHIGQLAEGIAEIAHTASLMIASGVMKRISRSGAIALGQLHGLLAAYARLDDGEAVEVWRSEEELKAGCQAVVRELLACSVDDPRTVGLSAQLIGLVNDIEHIGELCAKSAESIYRFVLGKLPAEDDPRGGRSTFRSVTCDRAGESPHNSR